MSAKLNRRSFLTASAATLTAPRLAVAAEQRVLRFVPQADLAAVDPVFTSAYVTRNHGYLVFDTLYGMDENYRPQPQMVAGHTIDDDDKTWTFTLRDGLKFHDGTPVLGRDAAASIKRWGKRDTFGQALMAATDEVSAPDDRTIVLRLKYSFPVADALSSTGSNVCFVMPEHLALTDAFTQVKDPTGSGPFRFRADERIPGARVVYER